MSLPDYEGWACFVVVVENGSFTAAAAASGLSKASVSKAVSRLEAALGLALFHRSSRRVTLSTTGAALLPQARAMVAAAEAATDMAREGRHDLAGPIRMTAPMSFGIRILGDPLAQFLARHPAVTIDAVLDDAPSDLIEQGFDLALRIADLPDSSLLARTIAPVPLSLLASPAYLQRHGSPGHPLDLTGHRLIGYGHRDHAGALYFRRGEEQAAVQPNGPLFANNGDIMLPLLIAGEGAAVLPDFIAAAELADGRLVRLLTDWALPPISLHLVMPPSRLRPARVTALSDHLAATLKSICAGRDSPESLG